jgi:hypothetical protein
LALAPPAIASAQAQAQAQTMAIQATGGSEKWTVPIGGGCGRVFGLGTQKVSASLQAFWNVVKPDGAGDWTLRAQAQFLFTR